jgi:ferrous iron transport protein A
LDDSRCRDRADDSGFPVPGGRPIAYNRDWFSFVKTTVTLLELSRGVGATVDEVRDATPSDTIARRLRELGFVGGERVFKVATGPFGREPLLVQIGYTRFALRASEAARVIVSEVDGRDE